MQIQFATADPDRARKNLQRGLGDYANVDPDFIDHLIYMVEEGKIRVGDPMMYGEQAPIYPANNWTEADRKDMERRYNAFIRRCAAQ